MPPLTLHIALARDALASLPGSAVPSELGAYYLGATTPDIRVLTRWEREQTHFYDIHCFEPQSSVDRLFESFPELARPENLNPSTSAFVAGYITHLSMDQNYIEGVYRSCFGGAGSVEDQRRRDLMDRVLQYELDRRLREDRDLMAHVREEVRRAPLDIKVAFLDKEALEQWRETVIRVTENPPDWMNFRRVASRHLTAAGIEDEDAFQAFLRGLPQLLQETIELAQQERIDVFLARSLEHANRTLVRYLDCG